MWGIHKHRNTIFFCSSWVSVSEESVMTLMGGLVVIVLFILLPSWFKGNADKDDQNAAQTKSLSQLKVRYLSVFWLASLSDWLQVFLYLSIYLSCSSPCNVPTKLSSNRVCIHRVRTHTRFIHSTITESKEVGKLCLRLQCMCPFCALHCCHHLDIITFKNRWLFRRKPRHHATFFDWIHRKHGVRDLRRRYLDEQSLLQTRANPYIF